MDGKRSLAITAGFALCLTTLTATSILVAFQMQRANQLLAVIAATENDIGSLIDAKTDSLEDAINNIAGLE